MSETVVVRKWPDGSERKPSKWHQKWSEEDFGHDALGCACSRHMPPGP